MNVLKFEKANCKNCYKCVRVCPVKSIIIKDENAEILPSDCILCGRCIEACPQNAKTVQSDLNIVKEYIKSGFKVYATLAPSFVSSFCMTNHNQLATAIKMLGFCGVSETSVGAKLVTDDYIRMLTSGEIKNIITTCCPTVNELIEKKYPQLIKYMAPTISPMIAHARKIKLENGRDIKVIFIGPCISKKREAKDIRHDNEVDAVLTFEELQSWLENEKIELPNLQPSPFDEDTGITRLYPTCGGVIKSIKSSYDIKNYNSICADGLENCIEALEALEKGSLTQCFIELMACDGGCINGPAISKKVNSNKFKSAVDIKYYAKENSKEVKSIGAEISLRKLFIDKSTAEFNPTEDEITNVLKKIGKETKEQELNCGFCGYKSCREKASAVLQGKAQLNMCLPYMTERAQSFSNIVMEQSPNIIIAVDKDMKIHEFNRAACHVFGVSRTDALGKYLFEFIDVTSFDFVFDRKENIFDKKVSYPDYGIVTEQSIVYIPENDIIIAIFKDITKEVESAEKAYKLKLDTVDMAQKVIDKQMMVAQEIASLLGETTAETKVTLTKLKDAIVYDGENDK